MWEGSVLFFSSKKIRGTVAFLFVRLAFFLMLPVATPSQTTPTATARDSSPPAKTVLLLYGDSDRTPVGEEQDRLLRQTLTSYKGQLNILTETMDDAVLGGDSDDKLQAELFRQEFKTVHFDLIVAIKSPAFAFAARHRADVFGNPPLVFCDVDKHEEVLGKLEPGVGGAVVDLDIDSFLSVIHQVQPTVTQVSLIIGDSPAELGLLKVTGRKSGAEPSLNIDYWVGLTLSEVRTRLAGLPKNSAVLYTSEFRDREGHYSVPKDFLAAIAPYSAAPIYSISTTFLGTGTVGGILYDPTADVKTATDLAMPVLNGEDPAALHATIEPSVLAFDDRALRRYAIPEANLPAGSSLLFQEPPIWARYRRQLGGVLVFIAIQSALILGLFFEVRERRRAQHLVAQRLAVEQLISDFSSRLAASSDDDLDAEIDAGLRQMMRLERTDRVCWYVISEGVKAFEQKYSVHTSELPDSPGFISFESTPWTAASLLEGKRVVLNNLDDLPTAAQVDREYFNKINAKSVALIPSHSGPGERGVLGLIAISARRNWPRELIGQLGILGDVIGAVVQRKKAMKSRTESDSRFLRIFQESPIGIALESMEGGLLFVNPALCSFFGYEVDELAGRTCAELSNPEDVQRELILFEQLREGKIDHYQIEKRFLRKEGQEVLGRVNVSLLKSDNFDPLVIGMVEDITGQKLTEKKLEVAEVDRQNLASRLIKAQDEERLRISRELHDDIGQRVSLVSVELDGFLRSLLFAEPEAMESLRKVRRDIDDLATDIHQLSHELHSSKLQHLGLPAVLRELCQNISQQHSIKVDLQIGSQARQLSSDVALCLFRVTQEALTNIAKHSESETALVEVTEVEGWIYLRIKDWGAGFDASLPSQGIGLASMRERLRIAGGHLFVKSSPGNGTEITAQVRRAQLALAANSSVA
jgi:PAS domain S-box-containing protein